MLLIIQEYSSLKRAYLAPTWVFYTPVHKAMNKDMCEQDWFLDLNQTK